jgi:hypothetical protein
MKFNPLILAIALALVRFAPDACSQEVSDPIAADAPAPAPAPASEDAAAKDWRLMASPLTLHFHPDPEHRYVYMLGLERQYTGGLLLGAAYFQNSFGQPSGYAFAGRRFSHVAGYQPLFVELSAGVIYGYVPPYNHKVPFVVNGFSPGALAAAGWQITPTFSAQLNLLGLAAVMFQFSADF